MNKAIHFSDGTTVIALTRRDGSVLPCTIDTADYELVKGHHWRAKKGRNTFYVHTNVKADGKETTLDMHSLLLPDTVEVDHKDFDGLNNQRANLRPATRSQNNANRRKHKNGITSAYRGVYWQKNAGKFHAQIRVNGVSFYLGLFVKESDAALVYDEAALKHFGEFARLNFPLQQLLKAA